MKKGLGKGLGKGLDALLAYGDAAGETQEGAGVAFEVDINKIEPNREQPRKYFVQDQIDELTASVREYGIIQPLIVKEDGEKYLIIAGERRWRAARAAKLKQIPVVVRECTELESLEIALIENIQRADLNPIEEAICYKRLNEEFNLNQDVIAKKVGKSRSHVANTLRFTRLDPRIQAYVISGELSPGHAKAVVSIENKDIQYYFAKKIVDEGLNVREAEEFVRKYGGPLPSIDAATILEGADDARADKVDKEKYVGFQVELRTILGTRVNIRDNRTGNGGGKIEISYFSEEDLSRIIENVKRLRK